MPNFNERLNFYSNPDHIHCIVNGFIYSKALKVRSYYF